MCFFLNLAIFNLNLIVFVFWNTVKRGIVNILSIYIYVLNYWKSGEWYYVYYLNHVDSSVVECWPFVQWVVGSIPPVGPIQLFVIPVGAPQLV